MDHLLKSQEVLTFEFSIQKIRNRCLEKSGFVAIDGVVERLTSVGVFMDVKGRRVFLPDSCMLTTPRKGTRGERVTVDVLRRVAMRRALLANSAQVRAPRLRVSRAAAGSANGS